MPVDEFAEFQFVHNHSGRIFRLFFCSQYYYRLPRVWPLFQNTSRAPFSGGKRRVIRAHLVFYEYTPTSGTDDLALSFGRTRWCFTK